MTYTIELKLTELQDRELKRWAKEQNKEPEQILRNIAIEPIEIRLRQRIESTWNTLSDERKEALVRLRQNWSSLTNAQKLALVQELV